MLPPVALWAAFVRLPTGTPAGMEVPWLTADEAPKVRAISLVGGAVLRPMAADGGAGGAVKCRSAALLALSCECSLTRWLTAMTMLEILFTR